MLEKVWTLLLAVSHWVNMGTIVVLLTLCLGLLWWLFREWARLKYNSDRTKVAIGLLSGGVAFFAILTTAQLGRQDARCRQQAVVANELLDLLSRVSYLAENRIGLPLACYVPSGKAFRPLTGDAEIDEFFEEFRAKFSLFQWKIKPFQYLSRKKQMPYLNDYITAANNLIFTTCWKGENDPGYHAAWRVFDDATKNLSEGISSIMVSCF